MNHPPSFGPRIDVVFRAVVGHRPPPAHHGYALFSAICGLLPEAHGAPWLAIAPLSMPRDGVSQLRLRLPLDKIASALPLAGKRLSVAGSSLLLGVPHLEILHPSPALVARVVIIKGYLDRAIFEQKVQRDLFDRGIDATVSVGGPRIVVINQRKVVGFGVQLTGLTDEASLQLQYEGLGGRQRFGCGWFRHPSGSRVAA